MPDGSDPQVGVSTGDELEGGPGLVDGLVEGAEDMGVVEMDRPHAGEAAEDSGQLGAVHAAQLGHPERQFTVAVGAGAVDQGVMRAQARAQDQLFGAAADVHRREHVLAVVVPVPGDLVELALAEDGGVDVPVAGLAFRFADVLLQCVPEGGAVGQPVRQAGAHQGVGVEEVQFAAEAAVVVHGCSSG